MCELEMPPTSASRTASAASMFLVGVTAPAEFNSFISPEVTLWREVITKSGLPPM